MSEGLTDSRTFAKVKIATTNTYLVMRLGAQARCLRAETGPIPVRGASLLHMGEVSMVARLFPTQDERVRFLPPLPT